MDLKFRKSLVANVSELQIRTTSVPIGIVVGMRAEARLLPAGVAVACSGGRPRRAADLARTLVEEGAAGLVSFGIAGGLAPELEPGTLVVGTAVDLGGPVLAADAAWCGRLAALLPAARCGRVYGAEAAAMTPAAKQALYRQSAALAVDLESAAVAEVCAAAGKPFAILRAVADPAGRAIPSLALAGLAADGGTRPWAVAGGLLLRPRQLPALLRLAGDSRLALGALRAAVRGLGPSLGFQAG